MKNYVFVTLFLLTQITVLGADLIEENKLLKNELSEQQKQIMQKRNKNNEIKTKIDNLQSTNELLNGKTPSKETQETVIWDFKLDSSKDCINQPHWPQNVENVKDGNVNVLKISTTLTNAGKIKIWFSKDDLDKVKGKIINCSVWCKGGNVNLAVFKLMVPLASGKTDWPEKKIGSGSFDWQQVKLSYNMPVDAKDCLLIIGLNKSENSIIYFKDLKLTVSD